MKRLSTFPGLLVVLSACGSQTPRPAEDTSKAPSSEVRYYEATGTLVTIQEGHLKIEHDEIPGFMKAMTMSFQVKDPALLKGLEEGSEVRFRVAVTEDSVLIEQITPSRRPKK